ncbi:hypothetical protein [Burkholderia sp. 3C]
MHFRETGGLGVLWKQSESLGRSLILAIDEGRSRQYMTRKTLKLITMLGALAIVSATTAAHAESLAAITGLNDDYLRYVGSVGGTNLVSDLGRLRCSRFGLGAPEDLNLVTSFSLGSDDDATSAISVKTAPFSRPRSPMALPRC